MTEHTNAKLQFRDKIYLVAPGQTVRTAVKSMGIPPDTVLPVRSGELILDTEKLSPGETITLIAVISGG
jgi:sulfur carrier protein ThiS